MDGWHECGSQCESIHRNLIGKILNVIAGSRESTLSCADDFVDGGDDGEGESSIGGGGGA